MSQMYPEIELVSHVSAISHLHREIKNKKKVEKRKAIKNAYEER